MHYILYNPPTHLLYIAHMHTCTPVTPAKMTDKPDKMTDKPDKMAHGGTANHCGSLHHLTIFAHTLTITNWCFSVILKWNHKESQRISLFLGFYMLYYGEKQIVSNFFWRICCMDLGFVICEDVSQQTTAVDKENLRKWFKETILTAPPDWHMGHAGHFHFQERTCCNGKTSNRRT